MLLIADGGSTKCDWILLDNHGTQQFKTRTKGLNPTVFEYDILMRRITENETLSRIKSQITRVDFYGAGCGTTRPAKILRQIIQQHFSQAKVTVEEDMKAAALSVTTKPGIICILGTGSNSCYFDGQNIHMPIKSLGFILMDEASGNYFGKQLIRDYYYNCMPKNLVKKFEAQFNLNADEIKRNIYKEENPNTYLAHFAEFIFNCGEENLNRYFYKLLSNGMTDFIEKRVLCYPEAQNVPIHFVGSIAHFSKEIIEKVLATYHLKLGHVTRRPINGLIEYYRQHALN